MRGAKKSRNGCARCKGQRLKCDEQKPACGRCVRVGVQCPGYTQRLKWSTKYEPSVQHHSVNEAQTRISPVIRKQNDGQDIQSRRSHRSASPLQDLGTNRLQSKEPIEERIVDPSSPWQLDLDHFFPDCDDSWNLPVNTLTFSPLAHHLNSGVEISPFPSIRCSPEPEPERERDSQDDSSIIHQTTGRVNSSGDLFELQDKSSGWHVLPDQSSSLPVYKALNDTSSILTEYYFKETAQLYSCYDSAMNPFRTIVWRLWGSSPVITRTLQSMAAACLVDNFPHLGPVGKQLRREAEDLLKDQQDSDDRALLAIIMLGGTASWHDPKDLGLSYFNRARKRLDAMGAEDLPQGHGNNLLFFREAMTYWEMLLAYVADDQALAHGINNDLPSHYYPSKKVPHPWTGVARDTQNTLQEIGRLIRRQRRRAHAHGFASQRRIREMQQDMVEAEKFEEHLLSLTFPPEEEVVSPEDRQTPVWHLLTLAEVYRRTGLLQLYRVFPDLLHRRLPLSDINATINREHQPLQHLSTTGLNEDDIDLPSPIRNEWLTTFALDTLTLLKQVPAESGTKDFQPFLLVLLSNELRYTKTSPPPPTSSTTVNASDSPTLRSIQISKTRGMILTRLNTYLQLLPPKPIHVCLKIVKATWDKMDRSLKIRTNKVRPPKPPPSTRQLHQQRQRQQQANTTKNKRKRRPTDDDDVPVAQDTRPIDEHELGHRGGRRGGGIYHHYDHQDDHDDAGRQDNDDEEDKEDGDAADDQGLEEDEDEDDEEEEEEEIYWMDVMMANGWETTMA